MKNKILKKLKIKFLSNLYSMFPIKIFPSLIPFASFVEETFIPSIASLRVVNSNAAAEPLTGASSFHHFSHPAPVRGFFNFVLAIAIFFSSSLFHPPASGSVFGSSGHQPDSAAAGSSSSDGYQPACSTRGPSPSRWASFLFHPPALGLNQHFCRELTRSSSTQQSGTIFYRDIYGREGF